jgi:hypothetical protein
MAAFFTSLHIRTGQAEVVAREIARRSVPICVPDPATGWLSAYVPSSDGKDLEILEGSAFTLSKALETTALVISVHDGDLLQYYFFDRGKRIDEYCSDPGFFLAAPLAPEGGRASAFEPYAIAPETERLQVLLAREHGTVIDVVRALARTLGILPERIEASHREAERWPLTPSAVPAATPPAVVAPAPATPAVPVQPAPAESELVESLGIQRDGEFMYYVEKAAVWRVPRQPKRAKAEQIATLSALQEEGYIYFLTAAGDVARKRRPT